MNEFFNFMSQNIILQIDQYGNIVNITISKNFEPDVERILNLNNIAYDKKVNIIRIFFEKYEIILPLNEIGLIEIQNMNYIFNSLGLGISFQSQVYLFHILMGYQNNFFNYIEPIFSSTPILIGAIIPVLQKKFPSSQLEFISFFQDLNSIINMFLVFPLNLENIYYIPEFNKYIILEPERLYPRPNYIEYNLNNLFENQSCYSYMGNPLIYEDTVLLSKFKI